MDDTRREALRVVFDRSIQLDSQGAKVTRDAERLRIDPAMRVIVGERAQRRLGASTSQMSRLETEVLTQPENLEAMMDRPGKWVDRVRRKTPIVWYPSFSYQAGGWDGTRRARTRLLTIRIERGLAMRRKGLGLVPKAAGARWPRWSEQTYVADPVAGGFRLTRQPGLVGCFPDGRQMGNVGFIRTENKNPASYAGPFGSCRPWRDLPSD